MLTESCDHCHEEFSADSDGCVPELSRCWCASIDSAHVGCDACYEAGEAIRTIPSYRRQGNSGGAGDLGPWRSDAGKVCEACGLPAILGHDPHEKETR